MASSSAAVNPPRHSPVYNPENSPPHDDEHQNPPPQTRAPRTHTSPGIVQLFKSLTLKAKLKMCKDIEDQNDERHKRSLLHAADPQSHPEPGSETASMFTIEDEDLRRLKHPSYAAMFKDVMPTFLANILFDHEPTDTSSDLKRDSDFIAEARVAKRRCMDGAFLAPRAIDAPADIKFPQIMFDTEHCGMIPLPLFLNSSLLYITVNAASVPTFKANPKPDEKKGNSVIDCKKLLAHLNLAELEIDKAQWAEASYNCFRFHCERDVLDSGGAYSAWWDHHFNFFNLQMDKNEYYDAWKSIELELRQEFYARPCAYDANFYARKYDIAKCMFDLKRQMQPTVRVPSGPRTSTASSSSFQSGSSKSSPLACCILCGARGHTLGSHANDSSTKFPDGRPTWAKYVNKLLQCPDGKIICIRWNIGSGAPCNHGKERVDLCSFCGGNHKAFSWTCRTKPADF